MIPMPRKAWLCWLLLAITTQAQALGLGALRSQSHLGERLRAEIDLISTGGAPLDSGCFHLTSPQNDRGLPVLRGASFNLRGSRLTVISSQPIRDPATLVAVHVGCGFELQREYTLNLQPGVDAPGTEGISAPLASKTYTNLDADPVPQPKRREPPAPRLKRAPPAPVDASVSNMGAAPKEGVLPLPAMPPDMLKPPANSMPPLQGGQPGANPPVPTHPALANQTPALNLPQTGMPGTPTLPGLEQVPPANGNGGTLPTDPNAAAQTGMAAGNPLPPVAPNPAPPAPPKKPLPPPPPPPEPELIDQIFGFIDENLPLVGAGLLTMLLVGLFAYKQWQAKRLPNDLAIVKTPRREPVAKAPGGVSAYSSLPANAARGSQVAASAVPSFVPSMEMQSQFSVSGQTVNEHFEANPVMELAEIMLSFGRVDGAAQALREFVESNPTEALQPWIKLMEVYRMAGMRQQFEDIARNLNRTFNVEVQSWDEANAAHASSGLDLDLQLEPTGKPKAANATGKMQSLEDVPRIRDYVLKTWGTSDCLSYLQQLLRDNRDGTRLGFPLPVVEEILVLIEVLDYRLKNEEAAG